jgi:hypothetical protein
MPGRPSDLAALEARRGGRWLAVSAHVNRG